MIRTIKHKGLRAFYEFGDSSSILTAHAKKLRLLLSWLDVAESPKFINLPGLKCHPLKGKLKGYYSIWVSGNWRLVFRFHKGDVYDLDYLDYH